MELFFRAPDKFLFAHADDSAWFSNPPSDIDGSFEIVAKLGIARIPQGLQIFGDIALDHYVEFLRVYQHRLYRPGFIDFSVNAWEGNHQLSRRVPKEDMLPQHS